MMYVRTLVGAAYEPWCIVRFENPEGGVQGVFITWCRRRIEAGGGVQTSELPHALTTFCEACTVASSRSVA